MNRYPLMKGARLLALSAAIMTTASVSAAEIKPAVVFDMGGKFDQSFNQGVYEGVERFKKETGISYREFEVTNPSQREQAVRKMAQRGASPIISVGFAQASAVEAAADQFPEAHFTLIDAVVDKPNVQSVVFKEHEGSFLVGMIAAMKSQTHAVSFVGGMDIPLIRKFSCGFAQGVKYADPNAKIYVNMTGTTPNAWNDPAKGAELARSQFDRGSDVVFAAAGATGIGVYQAAKDAGKYAIGVDSNQNHLHPGTMLTSMTKQVDVAAFNSFKSAQEGTWQPGIQVLGLAEGGVSWALDEHNQALITDEMKAAVDKAQAAIIAGEISVHDYMSDNTCPALD
jgi:basic membrane protein A